MKHTIWRPFPGFPSYEISSLAQVRRADTKRMLPAGRMKTIRAGFEQAFPEVAFPGTPVQARREPRVMNAKDRKKIDAWLSEIEVLAYKIRQLL